MNPKWPFILLAWLVIASVETFGSGEPTYGADPPPVDAELAKGCERLQRNRFYRHGSSIFDNVTRYAQMDDSRMTPADRFLRAFYDGRWDEVQATLAKLPPDMSNAIYDKMLSDLTDRQAPILTLDDILSLADAAPSELNSPRIRWLGLLLQVAVAKEQELWLKKALEKGTRRLGRDDAKRLTTGRILVHADFDDLARQYLPSSVEASQIEDPEVRDEVLKFLATQEEIEAFQQTRLSGLWTQQARILGDSQADSALVLKAAEQLADLLGRAPANAVEPWLRSLTKDKLDGALCLASALGRRAQGKTGDRDVALRTNYLKAQQTLLRCAGEVTKLDQNPWSQVATAMAEGWIQEAENTFNVAPSYRSSGPAKPFIPPGDLLDAAPDGAWAAALPPLLRDRIDVSTSKAVLVSDRYEDAVARIVQMADRNPPAGLPLAEEYLKAWAHRHDPQVPEAIRKQYQLPGDARIMVTPIMMEKNIASLAEMMKVFRQHGIHPQNGTLLVDAFNICYSHAEVYRRSHIESVFGPIDAMDEDVFLNMIRTMSDGLCSRWRKVELQEASGTRRTQAETLQMVRDGYRAAVEMIEQWSAKHPQAWRGLMPAGSLLSDWAQFEYTQQLVAETNTARMEGYQAKNNQAEDSFTRAAQVYAGQVPGLQGGAYSIDIYLAWFHSLLGIDSSGEMRVARPLDRRVLSKIRDLLRGLPGTASQAHVDKFAKYVSARIEDTAKPLHENLKYKYLAGSLVITQESPFSFQARDKVRGMCSPARRNVPAGKRRSWPTSTSKRWTPASTRSRESRSTWSSWTSPVP